MKTFITFIESIKDISEFVMMKDVLEKTKTLYVSRKLKNGEHIKEWWGRKQDSPSLQKEDMHVTIAFSKDEVDWGEFEQQDNELKIKVRNLKPVKLGSDGAVVLKFPSDVLQKRWKEFREAGASWDYDSYQPHVTVTYSYEGSDEDLEKMNGFSGTLIFGPEIFKEVDLSWKNKIKED